MSNFTTQTWTQRWSAGCQGLSNDGSRAYHYGRKACLQVHKSSRFINQSSLSRDLPTQPQLKKTTRQGRKKCFFKRIWSKGLEHLFQRNGGKGERGFFIHNVRKLRPTHQRGPSDPSGFVNLGRQDPRARELKVLYPFLSPDHCMMCSKQLHDSTSDYRRWKSCEARVYLPCGHSFGHHCLHNHLRDRLVSRTPDSDAIIVGGEQYCPMGNCIPIRYECDHLAIPTLKSPQPNMYQEGQVIPSECDFCSSDSCGKPSSRRMEEHAKKMLPSPSPRQYTGIPDRIVSRAREA
jgi:hypothetical protein